MSEITNAYRDGTERMLKRFQEIVDGETDVKSIFEIEDPPESIARWMIAIAVICIALAICAPITLFVLGVWK